MENNGVHGSSVSHNAASIARTMTKSKHLVRGSGCSPPVWLPVPQSELQLGLISRSAGQSIMIYYGEGFLRFSRGQSRPLSQNHIVYRIYIFIYTHLNVSLSHFANVPKTCPNSLHEERFSMKVLFWKQTRNYNVSLSHLLCQQDCLHNTSQKPINPFTSKSCRAVTLPLKVKIWKQCH